MAAPTANVLSVARAFPRERASESSNGLVDTQCWLVSTSDQTFTPYQAMFATGPDGTSSVPLMGTQHQINTALYVTNRQPERDSKNPFLHWVWVTYTIPTNSLPTTGSTWNVSVTLDGVSNTESRFIDLDNKPITNSGGEVIPGGLPFTEDDDELTISFNSTQVNETILSTCRRCVNTNAVNVQIGNYTIEAEPFSLYLAKATATYTISQLSVGVPQNYWGNKYVLWYREPAFNGDHPWNRKVVDQGYGFWAKDSNSVWRHYTFGDADGGPIQQPVLMDGSGNRLIANSTTNPATVKPVFWPNDGNGNATGFRLVPDVDFSGLFNGLSSTGSS